MGWGFIYLVASGDHIRGAEVGGLVCNAVALEVHDPTEATVLTVPLCALIDLASCLQRRLAHEAQ